MTPQRSIIHLKTEIMELHGKMSVAEKMFSVYNATKLKQNRDMAIKALESAVQILENIWSKREQKVPAEFKPEERKNIFVSLGKIEHDLKSVSASLEREPNTEQLQGLFGQIDEEIEKITAILDAISGTPAAQPQTPGWMRRIFGS